MRIAVLHQSLQPPTLNGVFKPVKPGGYKDSGADVGFALKSLQDSDIEIVTPILNPDPASQDGWTFPEDEAGLRHALNLGATHLWANVHTYASHPLQTSQLEGLKSVLVVGQPPRLAEWADDKAFLGDLLRSKADALDLCVPKATVVRKKESEDLEYVVKSIGNPPVIAKPPRGRGSVGVKRCSTLEDLRSHVEGLLKEGDSVLVEEYLPAEEGSVTVMPPRLDDASQRYMALPLVVRTDHTDGVMPYSGLVATSANSKVVTSEELKRDDSFADVMRQCETVAELLGATMILRIDVRRGSDGRFRLFDINLKPNLTGPGRPGRDDQASLVAMAAEQMGWNYRQSLRECLDRARAIAELRQLGEVP